MRLLRLVLRAWQDLRGVLVLGGLRLRDEIVGGSLLAILTPCPTPLRGVRAWHPAVFLPDIASCTAGQASSGTLSSSSLWSQASRLLLVQGRESEIGGSDAGEARAISDP